MTEWSVPKWYRLGDKVLWKGIELVCTRDHYAGDAAVDPWDPGCCWPEWKQSTLWAPNGPFEAEKLDKLKA